jgi:predicted nucleic acid-binding protein
VIYLDTSAFLKLYIREDGSEFVQSIVVAQDDPLPVWDVLQAELLNALRLKVFWGEIDAVQAEDLTRLFDDRLLRGQYWTPQVDRSKLLSDFRRLSAETTTIGCRTLDILHVACALQLRVESLLTFDDRQSQLAVRAGLSVQPHDAGRHAETDSGIDASQEMQ